MLRDNDATRLRHMLDASLEAVEPGIVATTIRDDLPPLIVSLRQALDIERA
jgi:hypothetical protein